MDTVARMRLELSSTAENMTVVRQSLGGMAEAIGLGQVEFNDTLTAVTEACNNVVVHAYRGGEGPLAVELLASRRELVVTVRDWGIGLTIDGAPHSEPAIDGASHSEPASDGDHELGGLGLPVIRALAAEALWSEPAGGGTEVRMRFSTPPLAWQGADEASDLAETAAIGLDRLAKSIVVAVAPVAVARTVLPRVMRAMASRARFSVERHADVQRVGSTLLGESANWSASTGVHAQLVADRESLEVAIGPLAEVAAC